MQNSKQKANLSPWVAGNRLRAEQAVDELVDVVGKPAIEAVLVLSAGQVAGPKQPVQHRHPSTLTGRG